MKQTVVYLECFGAFQKIKFKFIITKNTQKFMTYIFQNILL